MPSIGAITVDVMRGRPAPMGESTAEITRPGVDGVAIRKTGQRSAPATIRTVKGIAAGTSGADLKTHIEACRALMGTLVTVTDGFGIAWTNVLIKDVQIEEEAALLIVGAAAASPDTVVRHTWTVQATEIPA